jgi:hypothetical protein
MYHGFAIFCNRFFDIFLYVFETRFSFLLDVSHFLISIIEMPIAAAPIRYPNNPTIWLEDPSGCSGLC